MSNDSSPAGPTRRVSLAQTLLLGGAGLVLYALSPGPALFLMHYTRSEALSAALSFLYTPLKYLHDNIPAVEAFYDGYFALCGRFLSP